MKSRSLVVAVSFAALAAGALSAGSCGPTGGGGGFGPPGDGDGGPFTTADDASAGAPDAHVAAKDLASPTDFTVVEPDGPPGPDLFGCVDKDKDGWTTCAGDCDDNDPTVYPGAKPNCTDGKDHNCNGIVDKVEDKDKDGYNVCDDCNDNDPLVSPGAFEVVGNGIDDDCDGVIDEVEPLCDQQIASDTQSATDFAHAMDVCMFLQSATFATQADPQAHQVASNWGVFTPRMGGNFAALSTGVAADEDDTKPKFRPNETPYLGTDWKKSNIPNPLPMGAKSCVDKQGVMQTFSDPATVNDLTELKLVIKVPTNAFSFSFDFNFLSAEYPQWVCSKFNDKLLVILDSKNTKGNISFDSKGNPLTINNGFFTVTAPGDLAGTGMEKKDFLGRQNGGATGWLTTTAPVTPGETITLRFVIFDEGDNIYDSQVLIDNFRWSLKAACAPTTGRGQDGGGVACDAGMPKG